MSRLSEVYSRSSTDETAKANFLVMVNRVLKDCQPFLKDVEKMGAVESIWSGRRKDTDMFRGSIRTDRKPTDTHIDIHNDLDAEFQRQFGWPARGNSLFCTGDIYDADEYGVPYAIYPIGNWKFLWNPDIGDLYIWLRRNILSGIGNRDNPLLMTFFNKVMYDEKGESILTMFEKWYKDWSKNGGPNGRYVYKSDDEYIEVPKSKTKTAKEYIKSKMVDSDDFTTFDLEWQPDKTYQQFYQWEWKDFEIKTKVEFMDQAKVLYKEYIAETVSGYKNKDLYKAILSGNEIMVNCRSYWAIAGRYNGVGYADKLEQYINRFGSRGHKTEDQFGNFWKSLMV